MPRLALPTEGERFTGGREPSEIRGAIRAGRSAAFAFRPPNNRASHMRILPKPKV
jgi:hypothetical protein